MEKLVSIIIPTYNSADFIADTLASVQQQTYPHWEVILVDDGSTDATLAIAQNIAQTDDRIRIFKIQPIPEQVLRATTPSIIAMATTLLFWTPTICGNPVS